MYQWVRFLKLCLFILLTISPITVSASVKDDFQSGVKLFEKKEYEKAIIKFEHARKQGLKSVALYYNLGSTYFKLEKYNKSKKYFHILKKQLEMKSLAEYNLGLIALKQGDKSSALQYFKSVIKDNQDSKLVYLSKKKLDIYQDDKKPWTAYAGLSLGYDNNINIAPVGIVVNESGAFIDYVVTADYVVKGNRKNGWISNVILINTNYTATNLYDQSQYGIGIKKTRRHNSRWNSSIKFDYNKHDYSHQDYLSILKLEILGKYNSSINDRLYFRYRYENISSDLALYDYLDGWRQKIRAEYKGYRKNKINRIYYELELNNRKDLTLEETGDQFSYSPTRHTLRAKHTRVVNNKWRATGDIAFRTSDYPVTSSQNRNDDRMSVAAYADQKINKTIQIRYKLEYFDNGSSEAIFDYTRTVFTVGLNAFF